MASASLEAEEKMAVDWSILEGSSMTHRIFPESRIAFISPLSPTSILATSYTDPRNPFPPISGSATALYVSGENANDGWFRLVGRPFVEQSASQGTLEFEFCLVEGTLRLSLGHCDQEWFSDDSATYSITDTLFGVSFTPGQEVQIRGRAFQSFSVTTLRAGETYSFIIKWDMSMPEPIACFLNGEPLQPLSGPSAVGFTGDSPEAGINAFRISLGETKGNLGAFFLGRIAASSAPVDLYSPEGLINPP